MKPIDPSENKVKLYAGFALLCGMAAAIAYWLLAQLNDVSGLDLVRGNASADYAAVRLFFWVALSADLGAAGLVALWLRAELARPALPTVSPADADLAPWRTSGAGQAPSGQIDNVQRINDRLAAMADQSRRGAEAVEHGTTHSRTEQPRAAGAIRLVSNNPNPVPSPRNGQRVSACMVAVHAASVRNGKSARTWATARQDLGWEER